MSLSSVAIANRALTKLGEERIVSFSDNTKAARAVNSLFDSVRDDELRARSWSFAIARESIAADATAPAFGWTTRYLLPTTCLRLLEIGEIPVAANQADYRSGGNQSYTIEGRYILNNETDDLDIRYIQVVEDTSQWDSSFTEAFACRLAAELCETLTQSPNRRQMAWQEYDQAINKATRANAIELEADYIQDDTWIQGRLR